MTSALENPQHVGTPLRGDLTGMHSARRGTYRVHYRIIEQAHEVVVLRIGHRRGVYGRHWQTHLPCRWSVGQPR